MKNIYDVTIIGAGVIGGLIARELSKYHVNILLLEKENDVCNGTSAANSAIIHSGYDPKPGSLKAKLNVASVPLFKDLCVDLDVEFMRIGSLTVAKDEAEHKMLLKLAERAKQNEVSVRILTKQETLSLEPNLKPTIHSALFAPTAGIINPFELTAHAIENAINHGVTLKLNSKVVKIKKVENHFSVTTEEDEIYFTKIIINAAGVYADNITNMISKAEYKITPRKGSYFVIDKLVKPLVNSVVFPLPNLNSKGILVVPTTAGNFLVGPTSEQIMSKIDVGTDQESLNKIRNQANNLIDNIPFHKTIRTFSGLRATPSTGDFIINHDPYVQGLINVAGIESPGLASAPAIANMVIGLTKDLINLKLKKNFNPKIRPRIRSNILTISEMQKLTLTDQNYAHIICNCEHVTKAEIIDLLSRPIPITSLKAIKKRLRAGFGMCQGGFCAHKVMEIMSEYYQIPLAKIVYDEKDSYIIKDEK